MFDKRFQRISQVVILLTGLFTAALAGARSDAQSYDDVGVLADFEPVHWAYSAFFGTGWYEKKDARSVFVLRIPPRQVLREAAITENGERKLGLEIRYPLTIGLHDIDDLGGIIENDNFGTVSFVPGAELVIPINRQWQLRSAAHFGYGRELQLGESAWIYHAGIKSRYSFPKRGKNQLHLLNSLYYAGFTPDEGRSDHLSVAEIGLELDQPLARAQIMGRPLDLHWTAIYSFMGNNIDFNVPDSTFEPVKDQFEIGVQASFRDGPLKLWFYDLHRLGIGYRFSSNGEFSAITLSFRSWFTK